MKSAKDWANKMDKACVDTRSQSWTSEWIQQIQLDAMKEGARRAADIVTNAESAKQPWNQDELLLGVKRVAILTAAEQWTKKDL